MIEISTNSRQARKWMTNSHGKIEPSLTLLFLDVRLNLTLPRVELTATLIKYILLPSTDIPSKCQFFSELWGAPYVCAFPN